jgi:membrane fusion protein, heavy metal efflux system
VRAQPFIKPTMQKPVSSVALGRVFLWGGMALGVLLVALLLTGGFGLSNGHAGENSGPPPLRRDGERIIIPDGSPLRARLSIAAAGAAVVAQPLSLPGTIESDPARTTNILTPLAGRMRELRVGLGDRVRRGQVLAVIESADLAQAWEDDVRARTALTLAQKTLTRQQAQLQLGTAASRDVDQARSDHDQAAAEYARTQAHLRMLETTAGDGGHASALSVKAPFDGSIVALNSARGSMINDPTQPLMTLADLSSVWVTALVPEKDLALVSVGEPADVMLSAWPQDPLRGTVLFISDTLDADTRRNRLRIAFANPQYRLKPNMFATVVLHAPAESRVMLPAAALLMNNDRTSVFVATAPWTFERRTVEPLLEEGETVWIRSGLRAGEQVVVRGGILLND